MAGEIECAMRQSRQRGTIVRGWGAVKGNKTECARGCEVQQGGNDAHVKPLTHGIEGRNTPLPVQTRWS